MTRFPKAVVAVGIFLVCLSALSNEPLPETRKLALEVPLFDMHMHIYPGLTPEELRSRMDKNGVRWGGAVGAINPKVDIKPFRALLADRYFPTLGQPEMAAIYYEGGVAGMNNVDNPLIQKVLTEGPAMLAAREAFGYGELILNNQNSHPLAQFRRLAQVDSAVVRKMFSLVAEHGGIVQMHIEPHLGSMTELQTLLKEFPQVPVVIAHCLAMNSSPKELELLFESSPQVHCELSARTQSVLWRFQDAQVFGYDYAKPEWIASIEKYPNRYMVGTDVTSNSNSMNYDDEVKQIRNGLLPRLKPETLIKVAHGNAKRLMKVKE